MTDAAELARKEIEARKKFDEIVYEALKENSNSSSASLRKTVNRDKKMNVTSKAIYNSLERLVKSGKADRDKESKKPRYKAI